MPRALATTTVMVGLVIGFVAFFWAFGALLVDQLSQLVAAIPEMADAVLVKLNDVTGSQYTVEQLVESAGITPGDITSYAQDVAVGVIGFVAAVLSTTFGPSPWGSSSSTCRWGCRPCAAGWPTG